MKEYDLLLKKLEEEVERRLNNDPQSPLYGSVQRKWVPNIAHVVFGFADAYLYLYAAYGKEEYWQNAKLMIEFLLREQSDIGCWIGYQGFPADWGWTKENAPPGSIIAKDRRKGKDLIRQPFSSLSTSLNGGALFHGCEAAKEMEDDVYRRWKGRFISAAEFIYGITTHDGMVFNDPAAMDFVWNKIIEPAAMLYKAYSLTGIHRFKERGRKLCDRVMGANLETGEFPYNGVKGRIFHYHFITTNGLIECYRCDDEEEHKEELKIIILRALDWAWDLQRANGDFSLFPWDIQKRSAGFLAGTYGWAYLASAFDYQRYRKKIEKSIRFVSRTRKNTFEGEFMRGLAGIAKHIT